MQSVNLHTTTPNSIVRNTVKHRLNEDYLNMSGIPVQYPNTKLQDSQKGDVWAIMGIRPVEVRRLTRGKENAGRIRYDGILDLSVMTVAGQGDGDSNNIVDRIITAFQNQTISQGDIHVTFKMPTLGSAPFTQGSWWRTNVVCPFYSDLTIRKGA